MKHICETMKDYIDSTNTAMEGDVIFCSRKLWEHIKKESISTRDIRMKDEMIKYVMERANQHFSDDFPIDSIEVWIEEFFEQWELKNGCLD